MVAVDVFKYCNHTRRGARIAYESIRASQWPTGHMRQVNDNRLQRSPSQAETSSGEYDVRSYPELAAGD